MGIIVPYCAPLQLFLPGETPSTGNRKIHVQDQVCRVFSKCGSLRLFPFAFQQSSTNPPSPLLFLLTFLPSYFTLPVSPGAGFLHELWRQWVLEALGQWRLVREGLAKSPPDVSVHSRRTCFPFTASTFTPSLKLNIQKTKIMASNPISSAQFHHSVMSNSLRPH